ncbi:MAG TPA: glycosyltransferase family 2 protein [Streptosporangiaceae bacterium]|nr:glycosyltransferase family 2 protein [Streptosporangiaceae bacterium]
MSAERGPLVSVVIPVYGVRGYLAECLDSVLGGHAGDLEVIAIDDASPDGSGALLDQRARSDSRLKVVHLDRTAGPGHARNVGLAEASGRYAWFVDGDDKAAPGAIDSICARLSASEPDVLLIGYDELYPEGRTRPGPGAGLLRAAPQGTFTLAEEPKVIDLSMTAWSKLFRREFLAGLGEPFRTGIHEDIPVTCAALFRGRLSALGNACYCYRRSRPGSFMATTSTGHLAVFSAYEEVFCMLQKLIADGAPVATSAVQRAVFERAIWHYSAVFQTAGLVPRNERRSFFDRMHADFERYQPEGYELPGGARGVKFALIKRGDYVAYELLEPVNRLRVRLFHRERPSKFTR